MCIGVYCICDMYIYYTHIHIYIIHKKGHTHIYIHALYQFYLFQYPIPAIKNIKARSYVTYSNTVDSNTRNHLSIPFSDLMKKRNLTLIVISTHLK